MSKVESFSVGGYTHYTFSCPGCGHAHIYTTEKPDGVEYPIWEFNGDVDRPTFPPSLRNRKLDYCCHLFVTDGQMIFCSDSTHHLAGLTVPMAEREGTGQ